LAGVNGGNGVGMAAPIIDISGSSTSHDSTPPATMVPAIRGPMTYPTPMYSGEMSTLSVALANWLVRASECPISVRNRLKIHDSDFHSAPMPRPLKTRDASLPPRSPATSTSAHAVPSGYGRMPCSLTMSARRSGTIMSTPRMPPAKESSRICV
jgi:hypothetical protein